MNCQTWTFKMHLRQAVTACLAMAKVRAPDLHGKKGKLLKQLDGLTVDLFQLLAAKGTGFQAS